MAIGMAIDVPSDDLGAFDRDQLRSVRVGEQDVDVTEGVDCRFGFDQLTESVQPLGMRVPRLPPGTAATRFPPCRRRELVYPDRRLSRSSPALTWRTIVFAATADSSKRPQARRAAKRVPSIHRGRRAIHRSRDG